MSCSVPAFAYIQDVNRIVSFLKDFPSTSEQNVKDNTEVWEDNDDWGWTGDAVESKDLTAPDSWLQECCISLSPSNDTLVLAKDNKAVFLTSKWSKQPDNEPSTKYELVWSGDLALEEGECITDILCIPLASQHRSSQGSPDWTCIIAGFTSGYMRIYLQNGSLLLSQLLHDDPVLRFKCRTWQPYKKYGNAEQVEELAILYPSALVIIDGFSLYQSLRACRNQLARAQASGLSELIQPPPLAYKKWKFEGQKHITDIASCGVVPPCVFDQLRAASFLGGFNATIRSNIPAVSHYVTTGMEPFVAVYSALEGSSPALISDVALAVASKLTTAVLSKLTAASGWFGWGSKSTNPSPEPTKPKVEKGTSLPARFGLPDLLRHGTSITLSPNGRLAVTTDDFGRVMLLDVKKGIVVRLWKGYRDAECGWVMVEEEDHQHDDDPPKSALRTALFLVIYATKRGILEIWRTEQGPRVAAFNIGRDCRLLYAGHGIMGLGYVIRQGHARPQHTLNCTLIQGDGVLKTFSVPFHCALSDKHSKRVRDLHLLKKLSVVLDKVKLGQDWGVEDTNNAEKALLDVLGDIQTPQLNQQGLQCLLSTVGIPASVLFKAVQALCQKVQKQNHKSDDHSEEIEDTEMLLMFCNVQKQLLQTYSSIFKLYKEETGSAEEPWKGKNKELAAAQILGITKSEASELFEALNKDWPGRGGVASKNHTLSEPQLSVTSFLGCFECTPAPHKTKNVGDPVSYSQSGPSQSIAVECVSIRKGLSNDMTSQLSNFFFKKCLLGECSSGRLAIPFDSSGIKPSHLMNLLVSGWLSDQGRAYDSVSSVFYLHSLVSTISSLQEGLPSESQKTESCDNNISPWWDNVRHILAQSSAVRRALSLAAVCRAVAMEITTASMKVQGDDEDERRELAAGDWVSISVEMERWNLLVCQLRDLLALRTFINELPMLVSENNPVALTNETPELSVVGFLKSGHGAASQVLSKYVVRYDVPPGSLGIPCAVKQLVLNNGEEPGNEDQPEIEAEPASHAELKGLDNLRLKFSHDLNPDVLWAYCAIEGAAYWESHKEETNKLMSALEHLRCIHCTALQHGLAIMLWKRHFKEKVSATVMLMEKVGKAPKDRLCRKTVELSYSAVERFLKATLLLLELISEIDWTDSEGINLEREDFWHTGEMTSKSILEEAQEQPKSNVPLVELHIKLVTVQWIIMGLEIKSVKLLSLFDTTSKDSFMRELTTTRAVSSVKVDKAIVETREKFLSRALTFAVNIISSSIVTHQTLRRVDSDGDATSSTAGSSSNDWPAVVYKLAEQFGMDSDPLKRHYVYELYSAGMDEMAKEAMFSVHDQRTLGSQLLRVVGQRLAYVILNASEPTELVNRMSRLPTRITSWINSQDPAKLLCRAVPVSYTADLLNVIVGLTSEDSPDYSLTSGLAESIKFLL